MKSTCSSPSPVASPIHLCSSNDSKWLPDPQRVFTVEHQGYKILRCSLFVRPSEIIKCGSPATSEQRRGMFPAYPHFSSSFRNPSRHRGVQLFGVSASFQIDHLFTSVFPRFVPLSTVVPGGIYPATPQGPIFARPAATGSCRHVFHIRRRFRDVRSWHPPGLSECVVTMSWVRSDAATIRSASLGRMPGCSPELRLFNTNERRWSRMKRIASRQRYLSVPSDNRVAGITKSPSVKKTCTVPPSTLTSKSVTPSYRSFRLCRMAVLVLGVRRRRFRNSPRLEKSSSSRSLRISAFWGSRKTALRPKAHSRKIRTFS